MKYLAFPTTLGLCAGVALEFLPPQTTARLFTKDKYLEPMFGDIGQARTNAAMLLMPSDTTSSRTCTKPNVLVAQLSYPQAVNTQKTSMIFVVYVSCREKKTTTKNYFSTFS